MGPEELVLCLQQEACTRDRGIFYFFFFPWNKHLTKRLHVSPLVTGAILIYYFF